MKTVEHAYNRPFGPAWKRFPRERRREGHRPRFRVAAYLVERTHYNGAWHEYRWPRQVKSSGYHRYLKKAAHRLMRHCGRRELDEAPRRLPTRGWEW
jgi:hypothetical protein